MCYECISPSKLPMRTWHTGSSVYVKQFDPLWDLRKTLTLTYCCYCYCCYYYCYYCYYYYYYYYYYSYYYYSVRPSVRPAGRPAGRPSVRPSVRPAVQPAGRPAGRPSGRPSTTSNLKLRQGPRGSTRVSSTSVVACAILPQPSFGDPRGLDRLDRSGIP